MSHSLLTLLTSPVTLAHLGGDGIWFIQLRVHWLNHYHDYSDVSDDDDT